jgi:hypothetical protein
MSRKRSNNEKSQNKTKRNRTIEESISPIIDISPLETNINPQEWLNKIFVIDPDEFKVKRVDLSEKEEPSDANNWGWLKFPILPKKLVDKVTKWEDLYDITSIEEKSILNPSKNRFPVSTKSGGRKTVKGGDRGQQPLPYPADILRLSLGLINNPDKCCVFFYSKDANNNVTQSEWFFVQPNQIVPVIKKEIVDYGPPTAGIPVIMNNATTLNVPDTLYFKINVPECADKLIVTDPQTVFRAGMIYIVENPNNYIRNFIRDLTCSSIRYNAADKAASKKYSEYWDGYLVSFQRCNRDRNNYYNFQFGPPPNNNGAQFTDFQLARMSNHRDGTNDYPPTLRIVQRRDWVLRHIPVLEQQIRDIYNRKATIHIAGTHLPWSVLSPVDIVYRGMKTPYLNLNGQPLIVGQSILINQFTSTSRNRNTASGFTIGGTNPHIYTFTITSGVPYLNFKNSNNWTYYNTEFELLLYPNIYITVTNIVPGIPTIVYATVHFNGWKELIPERVALYESKIIYNAIEEVSINTINTLHNPHIPPVLRATFQQIYTCVNDTNQCHENAYNWYNATGNPVPTGFGPPPPPPPPQPMDVDVDDDDYSL